MATAPKFRIDVDIHNLLMNTARTPVKPLLVKDRKLPDPVFPRFPEKLLDPGPAVIAEKRVWTVPQAYRSMRGWLFPYIRSRVLPGEYCLPVCRIQVQSRLLVLLGLQQQGKGNDGGCCASFHRLAA